MIRNRLNLEEIDSVGGSLGIVFWDSLRYFGLGLEVSAGLPVDSASFEGRCEIGTRRAPSGRTRSSETARPARLSAVPR